jgi:hypothetical protein
MGYENYRRQKGDMLLIVYAVISVISLILFSVSESVKKAAADPITTTPINTMKINKTVNKPATNNGVISEVSKFMSLLFITLPRFRNSYSLE